ncbi:MAG: MFS transporter [Chloroflexi bacterium]|nr:MFS transporter [Chloroflexota bacterium]
MRRHITFAVVTLGQLVASVTITAVAVAFPVMITDLNTNLILAGWVLTVHQLVTIALMPLSGKASDALGHKRVFMLSMIMYSVGSLLSAIAPNIYLLILCRALQAVGTAAMMPSSIGIVTETYPKKRMQVVGLITSIMPVGQIIGPNIGGLVIDTLGWRSVFWLPVPITSVLFFLAIHIIPRDNKMARTSFDLTGAGLFAGGLSSVMFALSQIGNAVSYSSVFLVSILLIAGCAMFVMLFRKGRHVSQPLVDSTLLRKKPFLAANLYNFFLGAGSIGNANLIPLYAVSVYGMSTAGSGLVLTPRSIAIILTGTCTSLLLGRWGYRRPLFVGGVGLGLSYLLLSLEIQGVNIIGNTIPGSHVLLAIMFLSGLSLGIANPAANNACIELMPDKIATISGLRGMFRLSGGALAISISTVVLHVSSSLPRGFVIMNIGMAVVLLAMTPLVLAVPAGVHKAQLRQ